MGNQFLHIDVKKFCRHGAYSTSTMSNNDDGSPTIPSSSASAAAASSGSETIAQHLHAIQVLVDLYGFPFDVAAAAVDAVGIEPDACISYILDQQLAPDTGGPVVPIESCPHIPQVDSRAGDCWRDVKDALQQQSPSTLACAGSCSVNEDSKPPAVGEKISSSPPTTAAVCNGKVTVCGVTGEVWICLHCGGVFCSRYQKGHAVNHHTDCPDHSVHVSVSDLSVWCHTCSAYIATHCNPKLKEVVDDLETWKFGPNGT